jgi:hypothetical protein
MKKREIMKCKWKRQYRKREWENKCTENKRKTEQRNKMRIKHGN